MGFKYKYRLGQRFKLSPNSTLRGEVCLTSEFTIIERHTHPIESYGFKYNGNFYYTIKEYIIPVKSGWEQIKSASTKPMVDTPKKHRADGMRDVVWPDDIFKTKCTCGSEIAGAIGHSDWCDKYVKRR